MLIWSEMRDIMTKDQKMKLSILEDKLKEAMSESTFVKLGAWTDKISKISKVNVRKQEEVAYKEVSMHNVDDDGFIVIPDKPVIKKANLTALETQRLHQGDLVFGYRGKVGKIALVGEESDVPLIGSHSMMKIVFSDDRRNETPRYVQEYLQKELIRSYLNSMLVDKKGVLVLEEEVLETLPIPMNYELDGMSKYTTMINRCKKATDIAREILETCLAREDEVILLMGKSTDELSRVMDRSHNIELTLNNSARQLQQSLEIPLGENIYTWDFEKLG